MKGAPGVQLDLFYPPEIDLDGRIDRDGAIELIGTATYARPGGFYRCLARIGDTLATVEVRLRAGDGS